MARGQRSKAWRATTAALFTVAAAIAAWHGPSGGVVAAAEKDRVVESRIGVHQDYTRFVLELTRQVPYRLMLLDDPYRIVIDMSEVAWGSERSARAPDGGIVARYRYGLFKPGVSRVVIDLAQPAVVKRHFRLAPEPGAGDRIVLDLEPADAAAFAAAQQIATSQDWPAYAEALEGRRSASIESDHSATPERKVIVVDPGHGGVDPGAIGVSGTYEKHIALTAAKELKKQLEATGRYRVVLTRERDIYVPLRERYEVAHRHKARLFVSLHADAHRDRSLRGMSIYTLSENASDAEAAALAAKENKSDILAGYDLSEYDDQTTFILLDLAQRKTGEASWRLAETVVTNLRKDVQMVPRPHRFAGFAVLKSPIVPSVLVEMGYLSNRADERLLTSDGELRRLMASLARAIDAFIADQDRLSRS